MTLFSRTRDVYSHRVRLVLSEKNINVDVVDVVGADMPEDLLALNPYHSLPTLIDRDLVLYDAGVIAEYLDERFPHPPLMPVDPVLRAKFRLTLFRIEKDWYSLIDLIEAGEQDRKPVAKHRRLLQERIVASEELFSMNDHFLSDEFSLVDTAIVPLLWRLKRYGIDLSSSKVPSIEAYMERLFSRPSVKESLTELELEMR
ncbi:MAG: stringent starvation protein A [Gammaproteobacteria bacterium]|nr:stringent starvation protein A [Gammaproteobacteria bacterium]